MASGEKLPSGAMDNHAEAEPLRLEGFLPYRLNMLATEVSQSLARAYGRKFGISIPEWRVLATLGQFGVMTARDIGGHSRMHKTTVSRAVAALEKRRLIVRRANRADMREAFLGLTDAGTAIYQEIVPMARAFSDSLCEGLSDGELRQMNALIDKLAERVASFGSGG
ncbi:MAG: MarR family winged helix-turn-helix transcriptional regulator, partial [Rhabdaerophilum sp.]|jgi:DNA-binding MarR family transcriptional regulator